MLDVRPALLLALGLLFTSCGEGPPVAPVAPAEPKGSVEPEGAGNVVLVTLDGVRWQEIFEGADPERADAAGLPRGDARTARALTPNLHRLFFDQGTVLGDPRIGAPFLASGPNFVSLPGYVEIMTGAPSGCDGNDCEPHLAWAIAGAAAHDAPAAIFASWERIARAVPAGAAGLLVRAGRGPGEEAPPYPGNGEYLPDARTAAMAVDHLVRHRPRFLWVALGDTDEWAHRHDYRGYLDALRFADGFVGEIAAHLAGMGAFGARTTVVVTTDHGRDASFADHGGSASAGVWLMARGGLVKSHGPAPLLRPRHLRDIAPTLAAVLGEPVPRGDARGEVLDELL
jgi:hypothetical protein